VAARELLVVCEGILDGAGASETVTP
jgi:hypothetical protein